MLIKTGGMEDFIVTDNDTFPERCYVPWDEELDGVLLFRLTRAENRFIVMLGNAGGSHKLRAKYKEVLAGLGCQFSKWTRLSSRDARELVSAVGNQAIVLLDPPIFIQEAQEETAG